MVHYLFDQLAFVRKGTLKAAEGVTEEQADIVPEGFNNSIRWNLGHLYVVLERYGFKYIGLPQQLPEGFRERFEFGTSPRSYEGAAPVPTMTELTELLGGQVDRIREALGDRMHEQVTPYTTSTGFTLYTPEQFMSLALYHEGLHQSVIKLYKTILNR
ncbi:DinB family protein [Paenibacillus soyae]|uniref:DinB family protein n=1 Tax=Paenibacillus soyae TaxID=2969249 RepID=A0A9X2MTK2_9BACL|nr:DinB family protein [Paenibacillus soyae]MCR2806574.1 DinB family protein [Paenibacillus soyae]